MRLLLTHGYFLEEDPKEKQIMKPYVPLGILYLSSHLRGCGFDVDVYDSTFGSRAELFSAIDAGPPDAIGIYGNLMTRANVLAIVTRARAAGWLVIVGGPEPSNYVDEFLASGADVVVSGEGERTLERLMSVSFDRAAWPTIPGLAFRDSSGQVVRTGSPELIKDLDAQPWPDRERVDIPKYLDTWRTHHGRGSVSVITARGCPYQCNWCSHSVYGHTHRRRKPVAVVDEIEWLMDRYHPEMLWIADDVFTIHHGWLDAFAAEMNRRKIHIPFECITRADRIDEKVAALLGDLGCERVWIGSESGSQAILDAMQRGVTVEQVQRAVALCKDRGIATGMFLMWGYEGEQIADIEATVEHVKRCRPDVFFTTVSYPIKGTPYFTRISEKLVNPKPWHETTDREFTVRGRHSRTFYRHADELLRSEMADHPDVAQILAARNALHATAEEVEA
jgi:anaerobic magnesium-protoporphyrin IX monomethyl ester cyclase